MNEPWLNEPNQAEWQTEAGLPAFIHRHTDLGHLCGYVGVPEGHALYGKDFSDLVPLTEEIASRSVAPGYTPVIPLVLHRMSPEGKISIALALEVHGGITYTRDHKPKSEPDGFWWFGFDCGHCDDFSPGRYKTTSKHVDASFMHEGTYRTIDYAQAECEKLAKQLVNWSANV